ncbi:hypothetical protein GCM10010151_09430 [Actinoallomurus spadix]|uniref:Uncharacterized protein n=1 Tax=Actinoallomurus spadix TaxID=79912 RepID=A0ABN0W081_9ACTN
MAAGAAACLAATAPGLVGAAPAAHAVGLDQVCALSEVVTYSPPLTTSPQTVTFTSDPAKSTGTGLEPDLTACGSTGVSQLTDVGTVTIGI